MTADFWGKRGAGGTATAYGLLTAALDEDPDLEVTDTSIQGEKYSGCGNTCTALLYGRLMGLPNQESGYKGM